MESTEVTKKKIIDILFSAVDEINQALPKEKRLDKSPQTALLGAQAKLDSLNFVNLILSAEEKLSAEFGTISLAEAIVADDQTKKEPIRDCSKDNLFFGGAQLPVRSTEKPLTCHGAMEREAAPVYTLIPAAKGMEHTADPSFFLI